MEGRKTNHNSIEDEKEEILYGRKKMMELL